ncbi:hypothetical protein AWL63_18725 [Sphingomonas panacis]|uniref:Uncharacterized protein n=2 Tax=Sphingomonas panacis TaxID=1560345 RepID=A0A1B3ZHN9_9SPHN|nr:hypothetical protein AWL63_18725 [Sphingomonas panacis]
MRGIFSSQPGQAAIRLLVGTHLLLLVQAALVMWSAPDLGGLRALVAMIFALALAAFICAVRGENGDDRPHWRRRIRGK